MNPKGISTEWNGIKWKTDDDDDDDVAEKMKTRNKSSNHN